MTIRKGEGWGVPAGDHPDLVVLPGDRELAEVADAARQHGEAAVAGVSGGDLLRTLGTVGVRPAAERYEFPVDLGVVTLETSTAEPARSIPFVAHVTVRASGLGDNRHLAALLGHDPPISVAIMNAAWHGDQRLGPRAHPNDGLLDIIEGRVSFRQRREAARRAKTGSHLPHPDLRTSRKASWSKQLDGSPTVFVDGVDRGRAEVLRVELFPDALTVVA